MEKSCETCRHNNKPWDSEVCDGCTRADSNYEADLIDRRDAIKAIEQNIYRHTYLDQIIDIVKLLPSADRPTGRWISNHDGSWNCSECGLRVLVYAKGNFCPNCGVKMEGGDSE